MAKKSEAEGYISKAKLSDVRVSPRKARLVVSLIRGRQVDTALDILGNCDKKTAPLVKKLLLSAVANAERSSDVDVDELFIKSIWVSEGKRLYRSMPRAQGRATPIRKRFSTITLFLDEFGASTR
jgi:large subunit ribosomal protein L22